MSQTLREVKSPIINEDVADAFVISEDVTDVMVTSIQRHTIVTYVGKFTCCAHPIRQLHVHAVT
jgi:hypothetical protein